MRPVQRCRIFIVCLSVCWTQMNDAQHKLAGLITRAGICVPPTVTYLPYRVSRSTLTVVGHSQLLARWPGTHSRILSTIQRAAQTVLGVYLKRICSRVTSASSALAVLDDYALYKSTHSLTHSPACEWCICGMSWPSIQIIYYDARYTLHFKKSTS